MPLIPCLGENCPICKEVSTHPKSRKEYCTCFISDPDERGRCKRCGKPT